jgi:hypothetical protein
VSSSGSRTRCCALSDEADSIASSTVVPARRATASKSSSEVLVQPGHSRFTVMPVRPVACASCLVKPTSPCFAVVYESDAAACFDAPEPMLMIRPKPRSRIPGSASRVVHHADVRFNVSVRSKLSSSPVNGS